MPPVQVSLVHLVSQIFFYCRIQLIFYCLLSFLKLIQCLFLLLKNLRSRNLCRLDAIEGCDKLISTFNGFFLAIDVVVTQNIELFQTLFGGVLNSCGFKRFGNFFSGLGSYIWDLGLFDLGLKHTQNPSNSWFATLRFSPHLRLSFGPLRLLSKFIKRNEFLVLKRSAHDFVLFHLHIFNYRFAFVYELIS